MTQTLLVRLRMLNRWVAVVVGIVLLACAALVIVDIVLRQFGSSFGGTDEISGYVMAIVTSWGMAYAMLELGHVRIDILRGRMKGGWRAMFDFFAMATLASTITLIAIRSWPVLERSIVNDSRANTPLETPLMLVQAPWFAGWIWFACMAWMTLIVAAILFVRGQHELVESVIGTSGE